MAGRRQGTRLGMRRTHAIPVAAAVAAVAALAWPLGDAIGSTSAGSPVTETSLTLQAAATPAGWAPVPYRRAELSVPGSWLVESPRLFFCPPRSGGMIFAGLRPRIPKGAGCGLTASFAWILPAGHIPPGLTHKKPTAVIHGIPVYRLRSAPKSVLYLVPALGVRVGADGPQAKRVLATLNQSPLSVVLRKGQASGVPTNWVRHRTGGLSFATPRKWQLRHQKQWATCGTGVLPRTLLLLHATKPPLALPCPFPIPSAEALDAEPGLTAVTGKYAARSVSERFTRCQARGHARVCLSSVTGQGGFLSGVLIFSVATSPQHKVFFLLGLSGSGASARAIFDSIRPAMN